MKFYTSALSLTGLFILFTVLYGVDEGFFDSCRSGKLLLVQQYLDSDVSVHSRDAKGNTAIIIASGRGQAQVVELLLRYGANVNDATQVGIFEGKSAIRL